MKKAILSLLVLIGLAFGSLEAQNTCFGDWRYILPVTITNINNELQDFQVRITLNTQDLISAGKMNADGSDIRITSSDCCTPLHYWIQRGINTTTTDIWVRIPVIPQFSATTLTMYYGNSAATTPVSNLDSVMSSIGNDDTGTEVFNGGQSMAARRYAFPFSHRTVRWRIYSSSSADIRFKTVDSAGIVDGVGPVVTTGATPGFYSYDIDILGESNASPGWYSDSVVNFLNNCTPAGPCPGSCGDNVFSNGDNGAGTSPGLQNDTCGFYPSMKVWFRNFEGAFLDPSSATGNEFDRIGTVISASANPDTICIGDTSNLSVVPAGAQSYWWYRAPGTYISNGLNVNVTNGGNYYCVADFGSCRTANSSNVTVTVTVPNVDLGPDRVECTDSSYTLDAGAGYQSYLWSNGSTNQTLTVSISGTFWVEVVDSNNCTTSDTVSIQLEPIPNPMINPSGSVEICIGSSIVLDAFDPDWFIYSWSPGGQTSSDIIVTTSGDYHVTVIDSFGCQGTSDTTTVSFFPATQVMLPADTVICEEDSLVLTTDSTWSTILWADSLSDALSYTVYTQGDYWIEVTDANGCPSRDTIRVDNFDAPLVDLGNDTTICTGQSVLLDAGPGFASYLWADGTSTGQTFNAGLGTHFVQVISTDGCEGMSNMLEIDNFPVPATPIVSYDNSILTTTSGTEYQWYYEGAPIAGATADNYIPTESGPYYVEVTDDQQCVTVTSNIVDVIIGITQDDIPEGFSPNGDDLNDRFEIVGIDQFPNSQLTVMSRWGEVVFKEAPYQNNFDGTYNSKDLPDGTYFYILDLGLEDDSKPFNGYLIINR